MSGRSTVGCEVMDSERLFWRALPSQDRPISVETDASLAPFSAIRKGDDQQNFDLRYVDGAAAFAANAQALANQIATELRSIMAADWRFVHGQRVEAERFESVAPDSLKAIVCNRGSSTTSIPGYS